MGSISVALDGATPQFVGVSSSLCRSGARRDTRGGVGMRRGLARIRLSGTRPNPERAEGRDVLLRTGSWADNSVDKMKKDALRAAANENTAHRNATSSRGPALFRRNESEVGGHFVVHR